MTNNFNHDILSSALATGFSTFFSSASFLILSNASVTYSDLAFKAGSNVDLSRPLKMVNNSLIL